MHAKMVEKRSAKLDPLKERQDLFDIYGDADAEIGIISWGTVAGVAMEALDMAREAGLKVKLMVPKLLYPVAEKIFQDFFKTVTKGLVVEQNYQGQLYHILRMYTNVPDGVKPFAKAGSNPFGETEIFEKIKAMS